MTIGTLSQIENAHHRTRTLTLYDGISTIIGLMVGSGIFRTAGEIHKGVGSAGAALALWAGTGLLALAGALCYAELGTMIPGSGGEAQYLDIGFGPLMVFLFNWTSIMILKPGTVAILCLTTSEYLLRMTFALLSMPEKGGFSVETHGWLEIALGILCVILVTLASSLSTKWSNRIQGVLTMGKIGALALVIGSGLWFALFQNGGSVIESNLGDPFAGSYFDFDKFAGAMNNGLWAFEGWNNLNIVAGDLSNPSVNLPIAIWISVIAVVALYLMTLLGYYAVLPAAKITDTNTIGVCFGQVVFGPYGIVLMALLVASSTFGAALSSMVTSSEIVILAAQTGQLPKYFDHVSRRFGTATRAYWMQCIIASGLVFLAGFDTLITIYSFPTWMFYAACVIVLVKLRFTAPDMKRPYRVWVVLPYMFLIACCWLLVTGAKASLSAACISLLVVLTGIPLFYLFRRIFADFALKTLDMAPGSPSIAFNSLPQKVQ